MVTKSIANPNLFEIVDERLHKTYHGCDQTWYKTLWQRRAGCGPSVATNLLYYLNHTKLSCESAQSFNSKEKWLSLMQEVWKYVTPSVKGIPNIKMFYEAVLTYAEAKNMNINYEICDVPKGKANTPELSEVLEFLEGALVEDAPVAFLNLCNGKEKNLDRWHWVTIISLEHTEDGKIIFVDILDEGTIKRIDLALWYKTTTLGGGFVYFTESIDVTI